MKAHWLRATVTYTVCICLLGCTTASWRQAEAYANREPKYWEIKDVTFAAIRDQRFVRLCVKLHHFSEVTTTELEIDLQQIMGQLDKAETAITSIDEESTCEATLRKNESILPVIVKNTGGLDMSAILLDIEKEAPANPVLFLVKDEDVSYIIFGEPMPMYSDLSNRAFRCYAENQEEHARYLLIPLALVGDVVVYVGAVVACILLLPICLILLEVDRKGERHHDRVNALDRQQLYPLPPATLKPECN